MKVEQFEEKYEALQKEGNDIYAQIKPLLKRLKSLSKKCKALFNKADMDKELYDEDYLNGSTPKGWDDWILFRLSDFGDVLDDGTYDAIDNVLFNLKHTKFWRKGHKKMVKVRISTGPNSTSTVAIPEEVIKGLPSMDM